MGIPENIREFLRVMGRQGGRARAQKYSKEKLSAWGKLGGRPRKAGATATAAHAAVPGVQLVARSRGPSVASTMAGRILDGRSRIARSISRSEERDDFTTEELE